MFLTIQEFTLVHVAISLIAIYSGFVVVLQMLEAKHLDKWNTIFLLTTILTSATGFLFKSKSFGPPHALGVISIVVLMIALYAFYVKTLVGIWRKVYVFSSLTALYLNVFVGVVQSFQKIPFFNALAPTQKEFPFIIAQGLVLIAFVILGVFAAKRFKLGRW